jgi:hypothetical protein
MEKDEQIYVYRWGNSPREIDGKGFISRGKENAVGRYRKQFKGKKCRLIKRATMNSCLIEFVESKIRIITSMNAIKKV